MNGITGIRPVAGNPNQFKVNINNQRVIVGRELTATKILGAFTAKVKTLNDKVHQNIAIAFKVISTSFNEIKPEYRSNYASAASRADTHSADLTNNGIMEKYSYDGSYSVNAREITGVAQSLQGSSKDFKQGMTVTIKDDYTVKWRLQGDEQRLKTVSRQLGYYRESFKATEGRKWHPYDQSRFKEEFKTWLMSNKIEGAVVEDMVNLFDEHYEVKEFQSGTVCVLKNAQFSDGTNFVVSFDLNEPETNLFFSVMSAPEAFVRSIHEGIKWLFNETIGSIFMNQTNDAPKNNDRPLLSHDTNRCKAINALVAKIENDPDLMKTSVGINQKALLKSHLIAIGFKYIDTENSSSSMKNRYSEILGKVYECSINLTEKNLTELNQWLVNVKNEQINFDQYYPNNRIKSV